MTTGKALNGKPYAGNPHVRFDEGEVASAATPRRGSLLCRTKTIRAAIATICVVAISSTQAYDLAHRWSFNSGSLADSVGNADAQTIQSNSDGVTLGEADPVFDGNAVRLGSDNDASGKATSLNLGTGLIAGNDMTIELWATRLKLATNMRMFDWGNQGLANVNPTQYICVPWNNDVIIWTRNKSNSPTMSSCFANNVRYHVILTVKANGDGSSAVHFIRRNLDDPLDVKSCDYSLSGWTLSNVTSGHLYLGHSQWWSERTIDSNATYDEVRLYSGLVGDEQLTANAFMDPNITAVSNGTDSATGFTIPANATFTFPDGAFANNAYVVTGTVTLEAGAKIVFDTANMSSASMTFSAASYSLPSGVSSILDMVELTDSTGYEATLSGTTITVASKNAATWTGAAGNGDWNTAGNWEDGKIPDAGTAVTISGNAVNLSLPVGTTFACASLEIGACTFTADCDWRGLAVTPKIGSAANLNGHVLTLNNLEANAGASFTNTSATDGEVRFYADGDPADVTEATFVTGIANLTTAANAKIVILRTNASTAAGSLNIGAANNATVFRAEGGTITMTGDGVVGTANGGSGYLEIAGGTLDFGTVSSRGITIGPNSVSSRAVMTISSGKLRTNWIDASGKNNVECRIVQTGGEVETGTINNGNLYLGRWSGGNATYEMSGGVINQGMAQNLGNYEGSFVVGYANGGRATFSMSGGTINARILDVGYQGTGTFTQDGGDVSVRNSDVRVGYNATTGNGTYTLNSGTVTPKFWFHIGNKGVGKFVQNGGVATLVASDSNNGNWVSLADSASGNGTYVMNDGRIEVGTGAKSGGIFVGRRGTGRFEMNGGIVVTPAFIDQTGRSTLLLNGGTIKVAKDGGTGLTAQHTGAYGIFTGIDNLLLGSGATTIDTNGHDTKITGCGYEPLPNSALVKSGAGKLTVDTVPPVDTLSISNGTFSVLGNSDNTATAWLAHRWSFNGGSLSDSVYGLTAATIPAASNAVFVGNAVRLGIDYKGSGATSLNLGKALVAGGNATIEIWGSRLRSITNMRLFDWGPSPSAYICMAWHNDPKIWVRYRADSAAITGCFADNVNYHIALTIKANGDGTSAVHFIRRNLDDPTDVKTCDETVSNWTLPDVNFGDFYLGHSQHSSEASNDANAIYDEVRIWRGVLNDEALALSAQKGPDATAADLAAVVAKNGETAPVTHTLELNSAATLEIASGTTFTQPVVKGNGTVSGGTLKVADSLVVKCGETLLASGTVDFTDAKVVLSDPENLASTGSFNFLKASDGQSLTIVGTPTAVGLPRGWRLRMKGDSARISKGGFVILVK